MAVQTKPKAIKYIKNQKHEYCLFVVSKRGRLLRYVKSQTYYICLAAVKQNWKAFKYVNQELQSDELIEIALNNADIHKNYEIIKNIRIELIQPLIIKNILPELPAKLSQIVNNEL